MKRSFLLLAALALLVAAILASWRLLAPAPASSSAVKERPDGNAVRQYGHIKSLTRDGGRFELRFDPAWWLTGVTAERAAVEDGVIQPGEPVSNDYYILDEDHRLLTYVVPAGAHVTVLTGGVSATEIAVSELARIVKGENPRHRHLLEPRAGFWIRVGDEYPSPVLSLEQQYQP